MKFISLLKKELRELLNKQLIIGLVVTAGILASLGGIMSSVIDEATSSGGTISLCDMDDTEYTKQLISAMEAADFKINRVDVAQVQNTPDRATLMNDLDLDSGLVIIPEGFTKTALEDLKPAEIECISVMESAAALSNISDTTSTAVEFIQGMTTQQLMLRTGMTEEQAAMALAPITQKDITVVDDKSAEVNSSTLASFLSVQSMMIPIIIFLLVMYTSQMIINAVSTEKLDKTLETLLSAPVSRLAIISAKMLAAAIVALLNAVVYMVGFSTYIGGALSGSIESEGLGSAINQALTFDDILSQLGLSLSAGSYALIGLPMFLTILISLSVSMILGALVTDSKSAQTLIMPIMICAMVPYMISMVTDITTLSPAVRTLLYAIPFTHTFSATTNVMFGSMGMYWFGVGYQLLFFIVCMTIALKIFTSDKIFTISLSFGQKHKKKTPNA